MSNELILTRIDVLHHKTAKHLFSYEGAYVPGKGDLLDDVGETYQVKRALLYRDLPDDAQIYVKRYKGK